ncbi:MAG: glucose 1-dehydrogenase [Pseudomonadales bacterium]|jgi:NAD(P)-dependent dehydrogenase (short-subunit alcohol dehydrogenase family)
MNRVDGKVAIVTGGGSGLGEASSELLAEGGANIVVTDINEEAAQHTADIIKQRGGKAISLHQDVTNEGRWQEVVQAAESEFGKLSVLVNNAGVSGAGHDNLEESTFESWRNIMSINLDAVYLGCKRAVEAMKEEGGSIINISSVMGLVGGAGPAYNASKGGVRLLTKSVAVYCGNNGYKIRVNSVHPGYIWTPMVRQIQEFMDEVSSEEELQQMLIMKHPIGRLGVAEDIGKGVRFLASEDSSFMTGSELVIDGGYTAV